MLPAFHHTHLGNAADGCSTLGLLTSMASCLFDRPACRRRQKRTGGVSARGSVTGMGSGTGIGTVTTGRSGGTTARGAAARRRPAARRGRCRRRASWSRCATSPTSSACLSGSCRRRTRVGAGGLGGRVERRGRGRAIPGQASARGRQSIHAQHAQRQAGCPVAPAGRVSCLLKKQAASTPALQASQCVTASQWMHRCSLGIGVPASCSCSRPAH